MTKPENPVEFPCIICGAMLPNVADKGLQPLGGAAFETQGHYGSAVFDPMDHTYLLIAVCDPCLHNAKLAQRVGWFGHGPMLLWQQDYPHG